MMMKFCLLLSLSLLWLGTTASAQIQDFSNVTGSNNVPSTVAAHTPSTTLTLSTPSTSSTVLTTPTPSPPACTPVPRACLPSESSTSEPAVAVLATILVISLVLCGVLSFILCYICCRRQRDSTEIKKYVFEEGVTAPELWVEQGPEEKEVVEGTMNNDWESTTFTPSPQSKNTFMPLPDPQNDSIQKIPNGIEIVTHQNRNNRAATKPIPVPPVQVKRKSRFRPKRVAPPPPKMSKRKKLRRTKCEDDTVVYAVPTSSFSAPPPTTHTEGGYDVPRTHSNKWYMPNIYKSIDASKVKTPNVYTDLMIK